MTVVDVHKDPQTLTMTLDSLPRTHFRLEVEPVDAAKTRLRIVSTFASAEDMEKLIAMGMDEGIAEAVGQVDALLASDTSGFETLHTSGAVLAYDVHPGGGADAPTLLIVGCPMGADGFATLAGHFVDRTVVTYDPRGAERSRVADGSFTSTPAEHAEDLHRLAQRVSPGRPVDVFASSGGAVNALAWAERHPEDIRRLVAHEPPLAAAIPDRARAVAAIQNIAEAYQRAGMGVGMAKFISLVSHEGEFEEGFGAGPDPDPALFGLPTEDDGRRDDALLGRNLNGVNTHEPDYERLRDSGPDVRIAVGEKSGHQYARRAGEGVAARLGLEPIVFPGDHAGFLGGEYGQTGEPDAFAAKLHEVLDTP